MKYANYDFDDNILFMPTHIVYFAKEMNNPVREVLVSTEEFAQTRSVVGVSSHPIIYNGVQIDLVDYFIDYAKSFREFRDNKDCYFMRDLKHSIENKMFGPSWNAFVKSCSTLYNALNTTIITARGQSPATLHRGLCYLQHIGLIKHVPPVENMYPVSYEGPELGEKYKSQASNPQQAKLNVLTDILDRNDDGHLSFSDDDKKTFEHIKQGLKDYPTVMTISLFYTGK